jgi:hypothetical protein
MDMSGRLHVPAALPPGKQPPLPLHRRLGGPQSRSGHGGEEKIPNPRRESEPRTPIVHPVASRYTDRAITALRHIKFSDQNCVCISHLSHACYIHRPSHPPSFDHANNIW